MCSKTELLKNYDQTSSLLTSAELSKGLTFKNPKVNILTFHHVPTATSSGEVIKIPTQETK